MVLPSEVSAIVNATEDAARSWLSGLGNDARASATDGAAEALAIFEAFRRRMKTLIERWTTGGLTLQSFKQAVESEREAVTLNLAALANEEKRKLLGALLSRSFDFLGAILGAGLGILKP